MGNFSSSRAPPPIDFRVERCMRTFALPEKKVEELWAIFLKYDLEKRGRVMYGTFLQDIIKYPASKLTECLPTLLDFKSESQMNFGEYVELICTLSFFEETELLKYLFYVLDLRRSGIISVLDLKHLLLSMHGKDAGLIREALDHLDQKTQTDGTFNFFEFTRYRQKYPFAFHPLFRLQTQIIISTLGAYWLETHKIKMHAAQEAAVARERAHKELLDEQARKDEAVAPEEVLKKRMGVRYYLMPWTRAAEERKLLRIAAIEEELATMVSN